MSKTIRIGGASGYWGESMMATPQLLAVEGMDYLVYDFLAEITMSILARARAANPEAGYATDFITGVLKPNLRQIAETKVKILTNAGGVNPHACGAAARALIAEAGLALKVAVISGDDLLSERDSFGEFKDMFSGADCPDTASLASVNAYLGGFPVAQALAGGVDIVITGRSVDSAVTLGACIHAFDWQPHDLDKLAGGSLAGHIIECGPQASGGNFTDWKLAGDIANIGYPFIDIDGEGAFTCAKPEGTAGVVNVGTVSEQMLYEIGDPRAYLLPDVTCDFSQATIEAVGENQVRVANAKGHKPPSQYKVCATYVDGFRAGTMMSFVGLEAAAKAKHFAQAAFTRARAVLRAHNLPDFSETSVEVIGDDSQFGQAGNAPQAREVVLKIAAKHDMQAGAGALLKEISGMGLATPAGLSIFAGSRAKPSPVVRLFSFLLEKDRVEIGVDIEGQSRPFTETVVQAPAPSLAAQTPAAPSEAGSVQVPLVKLAWGRSGDKGNKANIGVIARDAAYLPYIWAALDEAALRTRFGHFMDEGSALERFYLPGSHAMNILIEAALGGGGTSSLRNDPQGKAYAQILLDHPISIPQQLAETL